MVGPGLYLAWRNHHSLINDCHEQNSAQDNVSGGKTLAQVSDFSQFLKPHNYLFLHSITGYYI